jgi:hypothetical protein
MPGVIARWYPKGIVVAKFCSIRLQATYLDVFTGYYFGAVQMIPGCFLGVLGE